METKVKEEFRKRELNPADLPEINFSHIKNLTDDTGIIQHAIFSVPNRKEGYCLDDNARALLLCVLAYGHTGNDKTLLQLLPDYLSFIHYMQTPNGEFKNFMSYTKVTSEERGSEDSFGRTLMALGLLIHKSPFDLLSKTAAGIFSRAYCHIEHLASVRGMANAIIGVCQYIKYNYPDDLKRNLVIKLSDKMVNMYKNNRADKWYWFEPVLTYDNAILPLALLYAYEIAGYKYYLDIALEAMVFLESKVFHDGMLSPVGNNGWYKQGREGQSKFDQQGIDVMAMVLYYRQAYHISGDESYLSRMYLSYQWFLGKNELGLSLYDASTGGCADGLHSTEISLNQGAESTLAYWISHMVVATELVS
jgi:hypothetical protein